MAVAIERVVVGHRGIASIISVADQVDTARNFRRGIISIRHRGRVASRVVISCRSRTAEVAVDVVKTGVDVRYLNVLAMSPEWSGRPSRTRI